MVCDDYRWDESDDRGSVYLPVALAKPLQRRIVAMVKRMVEVERQPVSKVLEFIQVRKKRVKGE